MILIAATNRPDVLDPALLRPGRFDRQIVVDRARRARAARGSSRSTPRKIPLADDVDLHGARARDARASPAPTSPTWSTRPRCSRRARNRKKVVAMDDFEDAKDKVLMGIERKSHDHHRRGEDASPPTTRPATRWSPGCCPTPTRCTRSRSSRAARRWASRMQLPDRRPAHLLAASTWSRRSRVLMGGRVGRGADLRPAHHRRRRTTSSAPPSWRARWSASGA